MSKIPSVKEFLITQTNKLYENPNRDKETYSDHAETLLKHVNFVNQPLRLGHYIPTYKNDQHFSKIQMSCLKEDHPQPTLLKAYQDAQRDVIFKGWEIKEETDNHLVIGLIHAFYKLTWHKRTRRFLESNMEIIDDMIPYQLDTNLTFE